MGTPALAIPCSVDPKLTLELAIAEAIQAYETSSQSLVIGVAVRRYGDRLKPDLEIDAMTIPRPPKGPRKTRAA